MVKEVKQLPCYMMQVRFVPSIDRNSEGNPTPFSPVLTSVSWTGVVDCRIRWAFVKHGMRVRSHGVKFRPAPLRSESRCPSHLDHHLGEQTVQPGRGPGAGPAGGTSGCGLSEGHQVGGVEPVGQLGPRQRLLYTPLSQPRQLTVLGGTAVRERRPERQRDVVHPVQKYL